MLGHIFFDPDKEMIQWLIDDIIKDRMVFDIGCGSGEVLFRLSEAGHTKLIGVDPFTDHMDFMKERMKRTDDMVHLFPHSVTDPVVADMISKLNGTKMIGLLCRPCHHHMLTFGAYNLFKTHNIPLYYIGLDRNLEQDLDNWDIPYTLVEHKGTSRENEKVYKLV